MNRRKSRWDRVDHISPAEDRELTMITQTTKGMTRYGNRARASVMLPVDIARKISMLSKKKDKTVNQIINDLIKSQI